MIEYVNGGDMSDGIDIKWKSVENKNIVYLLEGDTEYYRDGNEWYTTDFSSMYHDYIPEITDVSTVRIFFPRHSVDTYAKNVRYALTANTWVNGRKIHLGTSIFRRIDSLAIPTTINNGNDQYFEYVEMDIIDPYDIIYSDNWLDFRKNVCDEPTGVNNTGALLNITLYIVEEYDNKYILSEKWIGGYTVFNICNEDTEYMKLSLSKSIDPLGWQFNLVFNSEYDWLLSYLNETYGLNISHNDIQYELVLKSKDSVIPGPVIKYDNPNQLIRNNFIKTYPAPTASELKQGAVDRTGFAKVFKSWNNFEEGWFVVGSLIIYQNNEEVLSVVSNPVPLTQEIFKYFINDTKKLIDVETDMEIINYNVVNKIETNVIQLERPDNSKSNIIQPVFFKVKDTEKLTLHPAVTENICINLDDYKSKVKTFKLQIEGCIFDQIGVNQYGVLFKITGSVLPNKIINGTYYILNEEDTLVTTGKYKYVS